MLRDDSAERSVEPAAPAPSPDNRGSYVMATIAVLAMLAVTAVVLGIRSVGETDDERAAHGYRGEIDAAESFRAVAFDPDGTWLYAATGSSVEVRHPVTHRREGAVFAVGSPVSTFTITPDDRRLITLSDDGAVRVWDIGTRQPIGDALVADGLRRAFALAVSPDGALLAAAGDGGTALWNLAGREFLGMLLATNGSHSSVAFSPDGARIATGDTGGGAVTLWNTGTRQIEGESLVAHDPGAPINALTFDRTGDLLADGSGDFVAVVWKLASREHSEFRGHDLQPIHSVLLTADARTMITGSLNSVRIWDVGSASQVGTIFAKDGSDDCWDIALSPNGDTLAVVRDHRIQFWSLAAARK
jgi:WD40 repeat protein